MTFIKLDAVRHTWYIVLCFLLNSSMTLSEVLIQLFVFFRYNFAIENAFRQFKLSRDSFAQNFPFNSLIAINRVILSRTLNWKGKKRKKKEQRCILIGLLNKNNNHSNTKADNYNYEKLHGSTVVKVESIGYG